MQQGNVTPEGHVMFAEEYQMVGNRAEVPKCLTATDLRDMSFPPLLFKADGKRAPDTQQLCKHAWRGSRNRREQSQQRGPSDNWL